MIQVYKIMTKKENVDPEIWFESLADQERVSEPGTQLAFIMWDSKLETIISRGIYSARGFVTQGIFFLIGILIFMLLRSPCKDLKPYDNPFSGFEQQYPQQEEEKYLK